MTCEAEVRFADESRLVLSGYERIADVERETHFDQTRELMPFEGERPEASRGPPLPG